MPPKAPNITAKKAAASILKPPAPKSAITFVALQVSGSADVVGNAIDQVRRAIETLQEQQGR